MPPSRALAAAVAVSFAFAPVVVPAGSADAAARAAWPSWRGPLHTGAAPGADPPIEWGDGKNERLRVPIPGRGLASPVIWDRTVFLMTAVPADATSDEKALEAAGAKEDWPPAVEPSAQRYVVLALSRDDGSVRWQRTAIERVPHETHYLDASWASSSPVTDGERVIAHFGSAGTYAYDLDGTLLWKTDLGDMTTRMGFGEGSSPALHGDTVIINWDHEGDSFLFALDAATGKVRWKTPRPDEMTSWSTPLVVEAGGRTQVVVAATGHSRGYDLKTGEELWRLDGMTANTIPSPVPRGDVVYLTSGFRGNMLQAVDLSRARGDLGDDSKAVLWTRDRDTPYVASPVLYDGALYYVKHFKNVLTSVDATTGEPRFGPWRVPGLHDVWASPVAAAGRVYLFDRDGHATVIDTSAEPQVLAQNSLGQGVDASPAIAGDELWVRGREHLFCLARDGDEAPGEAPGAAGPGE